MPVLVIGLTGGVGSGKSTVAAFFARLNVPVIDSDQLSREAVLPGTVALENIVAYFGSGILLSDGTLDRTQLRQTIIQHQPSRIWLENLLHPIIRQLMAEKITTVTAPYCIVQIPLLVDRAPNPLIQKILLVDTEPAEQLRRVQNRDQLDCASIQAMMNLQPSRAALLAAADDVIVNNSSLEDLEKQVFHLHDQYLSNLYT